MKPELSNFFSNNDIVDTETVHCLSKGIDMTLQEYSISKGVGDMHSIDDNRSICQMLRNTNGLTKHEYHRHFVFLVNFANNAVKTLGDYSKVKDGTWGSKDKTRSAFTEDKRVLGQQYMDNPHHKVFYLLSQMKKQTSHERAKDYLVEVSYYFERVNSKLLEYDQK